MFIRSPKDAFVIELLVKDGDLVEAGTPVARLDQDEEDLDLSRTETLEKTRLTMLKRLDPPQLTVTRRISEIGVELAKRSLELKKWIHEFREKQHEVGGTVDDWAVTRKTAEIEAQQAAFELEKSERQLQVLDFTNEIDLLVDKHLKLQFEQELTHIQRRVARLRILAPTRGIIAFRVRPHSFVREGSVVAIITDPRDRGRRRS